MNGAESLVTTALQNGIDICFANAGTTEMPIVLALDAHPGIRPVLALFEGVCTGAADGYGRILDRPAMALLHLGPGFANGIANLHNARRGKTPILCIIGEHATWHAGADAPLAMDIRGLAGTVSGWLRTSTSTDTLAADTAEAITAARLGQIASLIVPADHQWAAAPGALPRAPEPAFNPPAEDALRRAVRLIRGLGEKGALILGGRALRREGLLQAARIRAVTGCRILADSFPPYMDRGPGLPAVTRIPYFPEPAMEVVAPLKGALLAGAREPVTFFAYQGIPSFLLRDDQERVAIGTGTENPVEALQMLADTLSAPPLSVLPQSIFPVVQRPPCPTGALTPENICLTVAAVLPENAIVVDEGLTTAFGLYPVTASLPDHSYLTIAGGSIGYGMPCATGAALAAPDRPVINVQADGSGMYTLQALWTQAREGLNVTTLICSNRGYNILRTELQRAGIASVGPASAALMDLQRPELDWPGIAGGMGVPGTRARTAEELAEQTRRAIVEGGPHLIEMVVQ